MPSLPPNDYFIAFTAIIGVVVFGAILSTAYLYVFNRRPRQSLHDLVARTYVVGIDQDKSSVEAVWPIHYGVVCILFLVPLHAGLYSFDLLGEEPFKGLSKTQRVLMANEPVRYPSVLASESYSDSSKDGDAVTTSLTLEIQLNEDRVEDESLAKGLARVTMAN